MSSIIIQVYIYAIVAAVIALLLSIVFSKSVPFRPDFSDVGKRKSIFWFMSIAAPVLTALLTFLIVYLGLKTSSKKNACMLHMCIGLVVSWVLYVLVGFIVSKSNKQNKLGSWF